MSAPKELFGGAISMVLPSDYIDASTIRQIPDTQEVFVSLTSNVSFIVEILGRVEPTDPKEAAKFHFDSLAHDNDAVSSDVTSIEVSPDAPGSSEATPPPILLEGSQQVAKFNRHRPDDVRILLALYRIRSKKVDLVLSGNIPIRMESGSVIDQDSIDVAKETFIAAARSLRIVDFGLFA